MRTWELLHGARENDLWRVVWNLHGPPKLCHFVWRACKGSLGVMEVLRQRHVRESSVCLVCGHGEESIIHALFDCKHASKIWVHSDFMGLLLEAPKTSFSDLLLWMVGKLSKDLLVRFLSFAWATLFCRNSTLFEPDKPLYPVMVAAGFMKLCEEYGAYKDKVSRGPVTPHVTSVASWEVPPANFVKINVDAHITPEREVQFGMVIRDEWGGLRVAGVKKLRVRWKADLAEAGAARWGVWVARQTGFENVILECDATSVVTAINSRSRGAAPVSLLFDDIIAISSHFSSFLCVNVKRVGNTVAHSVARWATNDNIYGVCLYELVPAKSPNFGGY